MVNINKFSDGIIAIKYALFFTSRVFSNTPRRVAAPAAIMGLCLLICFPI